MKPVVPTQSWGEEEWSVTEMGLHTNHNISEIYALHFSYAVTQQLMLIIICWVLMGQGMRLVLINCDWWLHDY